MLKNLILDYLILIQVIFKVSDQKDECCLGKQKNLTSSFLMLNCRKFSELNFTACKNYKLNALEIIADNDKLILDNTLNFNKTVLITSRVPFGIIFKKIKGFDLNSNPFDSLVCSLRQTQNVSLYYVALKDSNFDFYNNNILVDTDGCNKNLLKVKTNLITRIYALDASSPDVIYKPNICPLIFYKSRIAYLTLSSTDSLFVKNILSFHNLSSNLTTYVDSIIQVLDLKLYHIDLNEKLLNKHVFKNLIVLTLNGIIHSIDENLFKSFDYLKMLHLKAEDIRKLFQKNNKWFQHLNNKVYEKDLLTKYDFKKTFSLVIEQTRLNHTYYDFPDEDFCYFKDFPHNKLVMPILKPIKSKIATCTQMFLLQYSGKYIFDLVKSLNYIPKDGYIDSYYYNDLNKFSFFNQSRIVNCGLFFLKKTQTCKIEKLNLNSDFHFYVFDWNILIKYNQIIFPIILSPLFGLICIGLNILTIMILSNKYMNDKQDIYLNLKMNSIFVLAFNVISLFKLFYVCMSKSNWNQAKIFADFCLDYFQNGLPRYLNIILIKFLGNSFKTCSNFYYFLFTIDRFIKSTSSKNIFLIRINKISFKIKLLAIILISLFVNSYTYFQYRKDFDKSDLNAQSKFIFTTDYIRLNATKLANFNDLNDFTQELSTSNLLVLQVLNILKIIFSDLFFFITSILIDIVLLIFVKQTINKKIKALELTFIDYNLKQKKLKNIKSTKTKIISMIILNGFNFFLFRTPTLVVGFYGFFFRYDSKTNQHLPNLYAYFICRTQNFCNLLGDTAFFFYLISIILQFFIFFKLDNNFRICFKNIYNNKAA